MHWILQNNLFNESAYQVLLETLQRFDIPFSIHKVVPFVGELVPEPELKTENVICMGSYSMRHAARKYGWRPGVFDLEPMNFEVQLKHWGDLMLNADAVISRFEDAEFPFYSICSAHQTTDPDCELCKKGSHSTFMFMRPIEDSKVFAGKVFHYQDFYEWKRKVCVLEEDYGNSLTKNTLVQVCPLKEIYAEYRFWIVKQKIVCASLYKRGDRVVYSDQVDDHVFQFVHQVLRMRDGGSDITLSTSHNGWQPHEAYCLDVAETSEGMKIVEINTMNSSGFYACDIPKLVMTLEQAFKGR